MHTRPCSRGAYDASDAVYEGWTASGRRHGARPVVEDLAPAERPQHGEPVGSLGTPRLRRVTTSGTTVWNGRSKPGAARADGGPVTARAPDGASGREVLDQGPDAVTPAARRPPFVGV